MTGDIRSKAFWVLRSRVFLQMIFLFLSLSITPPKLFSKPLEAVLFLSDPQLGLMRGFDLVHMDVREVQQLPLLQKLFFVY